MNKKGFIRKKTLFRKHINKELCSTCKMCCCKISGCNAIPLDIEPFTVEHIIELIDKGIYSISYDFENILHPFPVLLSREIDSGVFNLNDRHKSCALLGKNGCNLSEDERPSMALLLIPKMHMFYPKDRACKQLLKEKEFVKMWKEKADIMEEVVKHYSGGKDFETVFWEYHRFSEDE